MKKILIYFDSMEAAGGIERVIANLSNIWIEKHDVVILVKGNKKSFYQIDQRIRIENLEIFVEMDMNSRLSRMINLVKSLFKSSKRLKEILKQEDPDIIYTATPFNSFEIFITGKKNRNRMIISEHGSKFGYNKVYNAIKKFVYPNVRKISVPTTLDTELYKKDGYPAVYIPHISTFEANKKNKLDTKVALNIGRLTSDKQQFLLLKIWNELYKENMLNGWKLQIVGKGEEKDSLQDYIAKNKMEDVVELLPPTSNIELIYKQASLFVLTSKYEGFGMVLLEAMSYGIPCISFDCPSGPRDIIKHNISGILVPAYDIEEYKTKLKVLLNIDGNELKKFGDSSYEIVNNWDNKSILKKWTDLFEEVIS